MVVTPQARGISLGAIGAIFAVHSAVAIALEVPSGALADAVGRRVVMLGGAALTALSLLLFAFAENVPAFMASVGLLAAGRALISGALEAWYVDSLRLLDPVAPLARGLSRGTAAEGVAMALGAIVGGVLVASADPGAAGTLSVYSIAALAGAGAALVYLVAVAALVDELPGEPHQEAGIGERIREILGTARREAAASVAVRVVLVTAVAFGIGLSAVELLWQPRLIEVLESSGDAGLALGALSAGSMLAVAVGAAGSPSVNRRLGIGWGYLVTLVLGGSFVAILGIPESALAFAALYLLAYFSFGLTEPMHVELLNEAVGSRARATLISAESLAAQSGALVANLGVGALAAAEGVGLTWAVAGGLTVLCGLLVAAPLLRAIR